MKTCVALCFIAAAIATITILGDAQSVLPPTRAIIAPVTRIPVTKNPHNCDCDGECKDLHHSRVPFKQAVRLQKIFIEKSAHQNPACQFSILSTSTLQNTSSKTRLWQNSVKQAQASSVCYFQTTKCTNFLQVM